MIRLNPNDLRTVNLGALDDADPWKAAVSRVIFGIIRAVEPPLRPVPIPGLMPPRPTATLSETLAAMIEADDPTPPCPRCAEAKAEVDLWFRRSQEHATEAEQAQRRLAAIEAARQGEPPMPRKPLNYETLAAWGRKGWDAAAALRVELEEQTRRAEQAMAREAEAANSRDEWRARCGSSQTEVDNARARASRAEARIAAIEAAAHADLPPRYNISINGFPFEDEDGRFAYWDSVKDALEAKANLAYGFQLERDILVDLVRRLARQLGIAREWCPDYQIEALDAAWDAAEPYCQEDRPVQDGEDGESREEDVPHDGFHDGHDTPEERDGER